MNTNATPQCQRCGAPLAPDAPEGLCPRCLMALNLAAPTEIPGETGPHGTKVIKPPPAPSDISKHFPQFEILECLGRGGMGVVYKARQPKLNRIVALKILAPEKVADAKFAERFEREAQALARLNHPNIVTVFDFGEADGLFYLMMEFVDGVSLRQLLQTRKITPEEALAIVPKICEALQFAHEQGVVHRDIKPENVLLDKRGRVKIADFGIAKIVGETPPTPSEAEKLAAKPGGGTLTQDQILGTPNYMAPEQVDKPQLVDHRADIYSLGVIFYEMLTGELPLGKFAPPSKKVQVDVRLDEIVLRALEKEPELRYQQASVLKSDVETIAARPKPDSRGREAAPTGTGPGGERERQLTSAAYIAWFFTGLSGILGTWAWLYLPEAPQVLVGSILVAGLLGILLAIPARRMRLGKGAMIGGSINSVIWLIIAAFTTGEPRLRVTGVVTDAVTGKPIVNARVADNRFGAAADRAPKEAWADANGCYTLRTWPEEHTMAATARGYETKLVTLKTPLWGRDRTARMDFRLRPASGASIPSPQARSRVQAPSGLVSWWPAEGSANDVVGPNQGFLIHGVTFAPGMVGQAFNFNGAHSYVQIPNSPSLNLNHEFTLELWYKDLGSSEEFYGLIAKRGLDPAACNFGIQGNPGGPYGIQTYFLDSTIGDFSVSDYTPIPPAGVFHHLAVSYQQVDASRVELKTFIDGQRVKTSVVSGNLADALNHEPVTIGATRGVNGIREFFRGLIDEVAIYRRALTDDEVQSIYAAGSAGKRTTPASTNCLPAESGQVGWWQAEGNAVDSAGANHGTLAGNITFGSGRFGKAFLFEDEDASVNVPASTCLDVGSSNGLAIEAWIKPSTVDLARPIVEWNLVTGGNPYPYGVHFWISVPANTYGAGPGCLFANLVDTEGHFHCLTSAAGLIKTTTFQHVAVTYDKLSGVAALYLNGAVVSQRNLGRFTPQTTYNLYLGSRPSGLAAAYSWAGLMDEVSIYSRALSPDEIHSIFSTTRANDHPRGAKIRSQPVPGEK